MAVPQYLWWAEGGGREKKKKVWVWNHAKLDVRLTKPIRDEFSGNYNTAPAFPCTLAVEIN